MRYIGIVRYMGICICRVAELRRLGRTWVLFGKFVEGVKLRSSHLSSPAATQKSSKRWKQDAGFRCDRAGPGGLGFRV